KPHPSADAAELRRRAEAQLRAARSNQRSLGSGLRSDADNRREVQELQVHQVELEMQNAELHEAQSELERLLDRYTDLYDFAPVGYFSLDEQGRILEANLTGAALLGMERSALIEQRLQRFVSPPTRPAFLTFLERVFARPGKQVCEATLVNERGAFWADLQGVSALSPNGAGRWCRVAASDISALKRADEAQRRLEAMVITNRGLNREIARRKIVEEALTKSEEEQRRMLEQSHAMQNQLRHLSRRVLQAQENERGRISRELHDDIAQTLVGINVHLESLSQESMITPRILKRRIARTQRLVEKAVNIVHQFARDLRPTMLDDLGLIPALHAYLNDFTKQTRLQVAFTAAAGVEQLSIARRTALYRVAQSALTNVARHAEASRVKVILQLLPSAVGLEIHDDGKSFAVDQLSAPKRRKRLGLVGMRERVEMVGGNFAVESAPGQGTTIRAQVPLIRVPPPKEKK
ncbi:MAG: sensor histidine kinase, partial [Limisphaerales bacterium]